MYYNAIITHDVVIGDYVEISSGAIILGRAWTKNNSQIGAGVITLPIIIVGENVVNGAVSVVTNDNPANSVAVGIPAKVVKKRNSLLV